MSVNFQNNEESQKIASLNKSLDKPSIVIVGNGPSLKGFDLSRINKSGFHSLGMNAAYKYWKEVNWWPTYFACYDIVMTNQHKEEFKKLMSDQNIPIKNYFYRSQFQGQLDHPKCHYVNGTQLELQLTTGTLSCRTAICLGYKKIYLMGIDANYVEILPEAVILNEHYILRMTKTPEHNPNYFFDSYQQQGERYNIPRGKKIHHKAWKNLSEDIMGTDIEIINCNPKSKVTFFPFISPNEVFQ